VDLRDKQQAQAAAYAWVDQPKGIVQLPLDRAMELTVQEINARRQKITAPTHALFAMISATTHVPASETDTTARGPLSLLILSAIKWLILSGLLSVIATIQLHKPSFLADCPLFTYGHIQALQETVFIYGWAANASFAVALWLPRSPERRAAARPGSADRRHDFLERRRHRRSDFYPVW